MAVIGGGNSAIEAALDMVKVAEHVDMVSVTPLTGDPIMIERLADAKNLTIIPIIRPKKSSDKHWLKASSSRNQNRRYRNSWMIPGYLWKSGWNPNSDMVKDLLKLNEYGEVPVNLSCETGVPGLFAAGDVTNVPGKTDCHCHRRRRQSRPPGPTAIYRDRRNRKLIRQPFIKSASPFVSLLCQVFSGFLSKTILQPLAQK